MHFKWDLSRNLPSFPKRMCPPFSERFMDTNVPFLSLNYQKKIHQQMGNSVKDLEILNLGMKRMPKV